MQFVMCDKIFQILPLYTKNITMSFAHQLVTLVPLAFGHINKCVKQLAKNSRGGVGGWGCCSACAQKQNNCDNDKHKQRKRIQTEYLPAPTHSPPPAQVNGTLAHAPHTYTHGGKVLSLVFAYLRCVFRFLACFCCFFFCFSVSLAVPFCRFKQYLRVCGCVSCCMSAAFVSGAYVCMNVC